jgi:membrane protein YqaA with SNARE-associated domain
MIVVVVGGALAMGVGSALLPLINAEAYVLVTAASATSVTIAAVVVALAVGQTMGKVVLFETARRGTGRARRKPAPARAARWTERVGGWLRSNRTGPPVVLSAAVVGIPPLAIVSVVAGAAHQRRGIFIPLCLIGRLTRFTALVLPFVALGR